MRSQTLIEFLDISMRAPKGQKAAAKAGRSAAAPTAAAPSTQLDDLPDSVLGLIFSFAPDSSGCAGRCFARAPQSPEPQARLRDVYGFMNDCT